MYLLVIWTDSWISQRKWLGLCLIPVRLRNLLSQWTKRCGLKRHSGLSFRAPAYWCWLRGRSKRERRAPTSVQMVSFVMYTNYIIAFLTCRKWVILWKTGQNTVEDEFRGVNCGINYLTIDSNPILNTKRVGSGSGITTKGTTSKKNVELRSDRSI